MGTPTTDIGLIAQAVSKIADIIAHFQKTAQVRRMRTAIDAGEKYIMCSESTDLKKKKKEKRLLHYKRQFFAHNN